MGLVLVFLSQPALASVMLDVHALKGLLNPVRLLAPQATFV
jgi:hypothetical protein